MTILGRSEELVSRCVECDLAEPESLASLGGSAPGVVDGILSLSCKSLKGQIPLTKLYGVTPDISILMMYTFYQSVYYASHNHTSEKKMHLGLVLVNM